jgi:cell wall assembly regulator SMI1
MVDQRVDALRASIDRMIGEIDRVLVFDGMRVAVLVSRAEEHATSEDDDEVPDDDGFMCVTIGLSNHPREGEIPLAELIITADGAYSDAEIDGCAADLARLARDLLPRTGQIDDVLPFRWTHVFARMGAVVLTEYMLTTSDHLHGIAPPVRLIAARPIFEEEARWMARIGSVEANLRFREMKLSWHDPERRHATPPLALVKQRGDEVKKASIDLGAVWADLEKWFSDNKATATTAALRKGASDDDIATLKAAYRVPVPEDLIASLRIHNGRASLDRYELSPTKVIIRALEDLPTGSPAAPDRAKKVKAVAWSKGWIPFAEDSGGNCFCVDMDPGENGTAGQVIRWERNLLSAGPTPHGSYGAWLDAFLQDALAGKCEVTDEGFVHRRD